jgi:hypothetical protein
MIIIKCRNSCPLTVTAPHRAKSQKGKSTQQSVW